MIGKCVVTFTVIFLLASVSDGAQWSFEEMNPGIPQPRGMKTVAADCDGSPCGYSIHYFTSRPGISSGKPTILYVSGGPGQIVNRKKADLDGLEEMFNIVYFDIRGAGLSAPQEAIDNKTDRFLRAKYVVADMEEIRKQVFGRDDKPWDAVYAHSAGTVFAQLYAQYSEHQRSVDQIVRIKTLILSAPISRHNDDAVFRAEKIASNFHNIVNNNTDIECLAKTGEARGLMSRFKEWLTDIFISFVEGGTRSEQFLLSTNNLCFVDKMRLVNIEKTLQEKLGVLVNRYGSVTFVMSNYKQLISEDAEFTREFPYPDAFFGALRSLDRLGSPTRANSDLSLESRSLGVDAALVLGYYLDSPMPEDAKSPECNPQAPLFSGLNAEGRDLYCKRFAGGMKIFNALETLKTHRSERAANVFGISAGIHRWPMRLMRVPPPRCITATDFLMFAHGVTAGNETARKLAGRVGFSEGEIICAWNPAAHKHNISTLILKGREDAATHGCQAEHFFSEGLSSSDKTFIEFHELGHDWIAELKPERRNDLRFVLKTFIANPRGFSKRTDIEQALIRMAASVRTMEDIDESGCRSSEGAG